MVAGNVVEVYKFPANRLYGIKREPIPGAGRRKGENEGIYREESLQRARRNIRRLVNANIEYQSKFVTLTFRDEIKDLEVANNEFTNFIKRLKRRYEFVEYLAVPELQMKYDRGVWHYHVIIFSGIDYIPFKELESIWGNGFVYINKIDQVDNVGAYVCKYLTKDTAESLKGKKSYFASRGLDKPLEFIDKEVTNEIEEMISENSPDYESEVIGKGYQFHYAQYKMDRNRLYILKYCNTIKKVRRKENGN